MNHLTTWGYGGQPAHFIPTWGYGGQSGVIIWIEDPAPGGKSWIEPSAPVPAWTESTAPSTAWVEPSAPVPGWDEDDAPSTGWSEP